jgi:hypothetical protein
MDKIIDMDDHIHWLSREEESFLKDHKDVNTFIMINDTANDKINYETISYKDTIYLYDTLFVATVVDEYITNSYHIIKVCGSIGYSGDTQNAEFYYDKIANKIYVHGSYRTLHCEHEADLFKDTFEMSYDKYWKLEYDEHHHNLKEIKDERNYEKIDEFTVPYYRFPRTKDGITIPKVIYNVFKVFSEPIENKPKIIIPNIFNIYSNIKKT